MDFSTRFGEKVSRCEAIIGYEFESKTLCGEALNASGDFTAAYAQGGTPRQMPKNDRLAVLGDSVAESHLCNLWFPSGLSIGQWQTPCVKSRTDVGFSRVLGSAYSQRSPR